MAGQSDGMTTDVGSCEGMTCADGYYSNGLADKGEQRRGRRYAVRSDLTEKHSSPPPSIPRLTARHRPPPPKPQSLTARLTAVDSYACLQAFARRSRITCQRRHLGLSWKCRAAASRGAMCRR